MLVYYGVGMSKFKFPLEIRIFISTPVEVILITYRVSMKTWKILQSMYWNNISLLIFFHQQIVNFTPYLTYAL